MIHQRPRSLLVATDLEEACDAVVRAAAALADHTGAELHVLHVLAEGGDETAARQQLDRQLVRSLPTGVEPASRRVAAGPVHQVLEQRAEEVAADLLVLGAHGRTGAASFVLGSTADRVLRTSGRPCLVIRGELTVPLRRLAVPVDFSAPSRDALELAARWARGLTDPSTESPLLVVHVGWPVTQVDLPDYEETTLRPQLGEEIAAASAAAGDALPAEAEVLWGNLPAETICRWAENRQVDLLVAGTHGRSRLPRAVLGSVAARLAREAPCAVLLVPPLEAPEAANPPAPALERILLATDFSLAAREAGAWVAEHLAPEAELVLANATSIKYPPSFLQRGLPPREQMALTAVRGAEQRLAEEAQALPRPPSQLVVREGRGADALAELARETGVDLVAVGAHGRREGFWADLGHTADDLLATSPVPVLVARGVEGGAPRHLLVPVDDSADARRAVAWAVLLAERLDARLTLLHVLGSGVLQAIRRVSSEPSARELEERLHGGLREWLEALARETGRPAERVATLVEEGAPPLQILAAAARLGCDLIVMGSRGAGGARILGLGTTASAVVRHGAIPVLVVPPQRP